MSIDLTVYPEEEMKRYRRMDDPATMAERNAATGINEALAAWGNISDEAYARTLEKALSAFQQTRGMTKRQLYDWINKRAETEPCLHIPIDAPIAEPGAECGSYGVAKAPCKLTRKMVDEAIQGEDYRKMGEKTTVCLLTLRNGFEVVGSSACVDPANFDYMWGKRLAREDAMRKVWTLEGYLLQDKQR